MNVGLVFQQARETEKSGHFFERRAGVAADASQAQRPLVQSRLHLVRRTPPEQLSPWSQSGGKRIFDCCCVLLALPLLLLILLIVACAVRLTSAGPAFFLQRRVGRRGRTFTILKFRTMIHDPDSAYHAVTTVVNQPFTPIGPFLRRWKLDELPQIFNVLLGHMSLVGPRPKMPEHMICDLPCRPGITGAATIAFAREETVLDRVPQHHLETYYRTVILPTKSQLDAEYMARATFVSDLKLIFNSVLRRWDSSVASCLLDIEAPEIQASEVGEPEIDGFETDNRIVESQVQLT